MISQNDSVFPEIKWAVLKKHSFPNMFASQAKGMQVCCEDLNKLKTDKKYRKRMQDELFEQWWPESNKASELAKPVVIKTFLFTYNWMPGSKESIDFHTEVKLSNEPGNYNCFKSDLVKQVILLKWNLLWQFSVIESTAHFLYVVLLCKFDYIHWIIVCLYTFLSQVIMLVRQYSDFKRGDINLTKLVIMAGISCITPGYWYVWESIRPNHEH
jgi:hypothetical protein